VCASSCVFCLTAAAVGHLPIAIDMDSITVGVSVGDGLSSGLGTSFLVGPHVEVDEQEQVAREESAAEECSALFSCAGSDGGEGRGPVGRDEVRVGGKVDDAEVDDELGDLHRGEVLLPPDLAAASRSPVVVIHEDVDGEVQHNGHPLDGGVSVELGEAEQCGRRVMEDVEEGEKFLLEGKEDGVEEFEVLERIINEVVELEALRKGRNEVRKVRDE